MKIQYRLSIAFLLLSIISAGIPFYFIVSSSISSIENLQKNSMISVTRSIMKQYDNFKSYNQEFMNSFIDDPDFINAVSGQFIVRKIAENVAQNKMNGLIENNPQIHNIIIDKKNGEYLTALNEEIKTEILTNQSFFYDTEQLRTYLLLKKNIEDMNAALIFQIDLNTFLEKSLHPLKIDDGFHLFIVDLKKEHVILHSDSDFYYTNYRNMNQYDGIVDKMKEQRNGYFEKKIGQSVKSYYITTTNGLIFGVTGFKERLFVKINETIRNTILLIAFFILLSLVISYIFSKAFSKPIEKLAWFAGRISKGEYETDLKLKSDDELSDLAVSLNDMAKTVKMNIKMIEQKVEDRTRALNNEIDERKLLEKELLRTVNMLNEKDRIVESELTMAKLVQQQLLPERSPHSDLSFYYQPMGKVGGDFFEFIPIQENKLGIFISDVSGHGVPAAMITMMVKSFLLQENQEVKLNPALLMNHLNEFLFSSFSGNFVTAFYGVISFDDSEMIFANAAHPPPFLIMEDRVDKIKTKNGTVLGFFSGHERQKMNLQCVNYTIKIPEKSKLMIYTDGLTEAVNPQSGSLVDFEEAGLEKVLGKTGKLSPQEAVDLVVSELIHYTGQEELEDDVCLICFQNQ